MKFTSFLQSLIPNFEKNKVTEDLRITATELSEITIPAYAESSNLLVSSVLKSKEIDDFNKILRRNIPGLNKDLIKGIYEGLEIARENLDVVSDLINKTYNNEIAATGMTYLKANLLQYVEATAFVSKYARKFLIYIYVVECAEYKENSLKINESLTKVEIAWIKDNIINFSQAFKIVSTPKAKLTKELHDIPDINITPDNEENLVRVSSNKIDPFSLRLIPIWLNPIYHIGMFVAEWQANRYKAAKEELKIIQLRKLHLERLSSGKADAKLEKEIAYLESRAQDLNYKIQKIEKDNQ